MSNRTICLINDSFPPVTDGVANAVVNYGRAITESGDKAVVVTPAYPGADDSGFSFPVVRYPSIDMTKLVGYHAGFPFSEKTMQTLMEYPFDLIHCHCPITSAVLARELRARIHVPTVFTYHTKLIVSRICLYAERPAEMRAFFILQRRTKIWDLLILSARKTA